VLIHDELDGSQDYQHVLGDGLAHPAARRGFRWEDAPAQAGSLRRSISSCCTRSCFTMFTYQVVLSLHLQSSRPSRHPHRVLLPQAWHRTYRPRFRRNPVKQMTIDHMWSIERRSNQAHINLVSQVSFALSFTASTRPNQETRVAVDQSTRAMISN
jgi:hypothetical protein